MLLFHGDFITLKRAILNYFSIITYVLVYPIIVLTEIIFNKNFDKLFRKISYVYICLVFFGFIQIIFAEFGVNLSYENLTEAAPENRSDFLGINLLRPNSLFGEPRNLSAILFSIYFFRQYFEHKFKNNINLILIILIGFICGSITFFLYLVLFGLFYFFLYNKKINFNKLIVITAIAIPLFFGTINSLLIITPRFLPYIELIESIISLNTLPSILKEQAEDLFFGVYVYDILSLKIDIRNSLFGNGLGSFNYIMDGYFIEFFNIKIMDYVNKPLGSRILPFTILLELGIIGSFLFFKILRKSYSSINNLLMIDENQKSLLKLLFGSMVIGSLINASYFFITGVIIIVYYSIVQDEPDLITHNKFYS